MSDKEIAKDILVAMIANGWRGNENSSTDNIIEKITEAYKEILKAVKES